MANDLTYDPVVREWIDGARAFTREHQLLIKDQLVGDVAAAALRSLQEASL